jgi:hypothetical protein
MKSLFALFCFAISFHVASAQDCIDSTLIDPSAICEDFGFPICGCDGVTYPNSCIAFYQHGVTTWTNGTCESQIDTCINELQLQWGQTIDCTAEYAPVCGCNQQTYTNPCNAFYYGGVSTYSMGHCDSSMYCPIVPSMADFGFCDMALGWVRTPEGCIMKSGCSRIASNGVDYSEYFFEFEYACNSTCDTTVVINCVDEAQINLEAVCPAVFLPVCGCNGVTYSNECEAYNYGGVTTWTQGECGTSGMKEFAAEWLSAYPNPASEMLMLKVNVPSAAVRVFNAQGSLVHQLNTSSNRAVGIDVSAWPSGVYFIQAQSENGAQTLRVVRE